MAEETKAGVLSGENDLVVVEKKTEEGLAVRLH